MSHIEIIANNTFDIIKDMNSKRKFANIYWTNICISRKYNTLNILIKKLSEVFKSKEIILNVLIVKHKNANYYSLDSDRENNIEIKFINSIYAKTMMSNKELTNYITTNKISLIILDEVDIYNLNKIKCANKIIITNECNVRLDYVKYKEYKLLNST